MKRTSLLLSILLLLSALTGYVLSKASLVGRVGISLFYKQYKFLKVWWQAGLFVFAVWLLLFFVQGWVQRTKAHRTAKLTHIGAIVFALAGLFFTYQDFRQTLSHRWLGERFHLGGYLFWIGWIMISVFYLTGTKQSIYPPNVYARNEPIPTPDNKSEYNPKP